MRREIVYVGRIDEARIPGIKYLAKVLYAYFDHNLSIVGDRDPLVPGTIFHPWKTDLRPTLQQAGIVAACGRSAREALASGCAVLLMQRAYDGLISPALVCRPDFDFSGNQGRYPFSRLIQDLRVLLNSPAKLRKLQHWSRRYAEECLSASAARQVAAVYEKVLQTLLAVHHILTDCFGDSHLVLFNTKAEVKPSSCCIKIVAQTVKEHQDSCQVTLKSTNSPLSPPADGTSHV